MFSCLWYNRNMTLFNHVIFKILWICSCPTILTTHWIFSTTIRLWCNQLLWRAIKSKYFGLNDFLNCFAYRFPFRNVEIRGNDFIVSILTASLGWLWPLRYFLWFLVRSKGCSWYTLWFKKARLLLRSLSVFIRCLLSFCLGVLQCFVNKSISFSIDL